MGSLDGKVAIVTGGAGGIGAGTSRYLADHGAAVVVADLPDRAPRDLAAELANAGHQACAVEVDITDEAQVAAMAKAAIDAFGRIDGLHANAAATHLVRRDGDLMDLERSVFEHAFQVNVIGTWLCCKAVIPTMVDQGGGSIVATSSMAATHAGFDKTAYGTTKASVAALMRTVATQYGKRGIRANTILPGLILHDQGTNLMPSAVKQNVLDQVLTPDLGVGRDIASLVAYLFSDDARYLQGQEFAVNGGMTVHSPGLAGRANHAP
ncbi:MAG: SDR family oxidoreductase [Acidimicrobiia bacterium]|nr:SDR family oxidoreductase [Acidimicrobiia bacterium]